MMADDNERFARWQSAARDQLGRTLNLTFGLTVAALGYWFFLLRDDGFRPGGTAKSLFLWSLLALGVSAVCALFCVVNRLWDVLGTARRVRGRPDAPTREKLDAIGRRTWALLYAHLITFAFGVLLLAVTLLLAYCHKLV
jgi:4-hydroxybenzoate polyprenyltransferase